MSTSTDRSKTPATLPASDSDKKEKTMTARQAIQSVLNDAGAPMKTAEIVQAVADGKRKFGAQKPAQLTRILIWDLPRADSLFVRTAPGVYGLRGRDDQGKGGKSAADEISPIKHTVVKLGDVAAGKAQAKPDPKPTPRKRGTARGKAAAAA